MDRAAYGRAARGCGNRSPAAGRACGFRRRPRRGGDGAAARDAAPEPGERVLELACGPGSVGIAAAALVGDGGEVVLSDVAPAMTAIAAARAESLGLENVSTRVLDLEQIDEPDESYDVVVCREGLMLVPDPVRAARELRRVLRPGGRVAVRVWGPRERNPWLGVVFDAVSARARRADAAARGARAVLARRSPVGSRACSSTPGCPTSRSAKCRRPYRAASVEEWWIADCGARGAVGAAARAVARAGCGCAARPRASRRSASTRRRAGSTSRASRWSRLRFEA